MVITAHNGTLVGTRFTMGVTNFKNVYIYVKYTKGDETSITITPLLQDGRHPVPADFFNISKLINGAVSNDTMTISATDTHLLSFAIPESADLLALDITFTGGTGTGSVEIFSNSDSVTD